MVAGQQPAAAQGPFTNSSQRRTIQLKLMIMGLLADVRLRDGERCARDGVTGTLHVHHRVRRSQCGSNTPCNLITLCWRCHRWVHDNPYAANKQGFLLRHGEDPAQVPVTHFLWPFAPVWLTDDCGFTLTAPVPEPALA